MRIRLENLSKYVYVLSFEKYAPKLQKKGDMKKRKTKKVSKRGRFRQFQSKKWAKSDTKILFYTFCTYYLLCSYSMIICYRPLELPSPRLLRTYSKYLRTIKNKKGQILLEIRKYLLNFATEIIILSQNKQIVARMNEMTMMKAKCQAVHRRS